MLEQFYSQIEKKMEATGAALKKEYGSLRTGRASISLLEGIKVLYYAAPTPINQVANLSIPDPGSILIQPWDVSQIKEIEKAILKSDLGLTPNNDGKTIRINIPPLTEERRRELVKVLKKYAEEAKVSLRNIRRDAMDKLKQMEKDGEISEDDHRRSHEKIQHITDNYTKLIGTVEQHKEAEIMKV
ncbi:MAG: ribosome recycling factor [Candidatus Schekmanbacteria bacterium]|nr:ribosome recycling factor [Candidatus Schekmanbacteria bacterium]